jgi:hypothetical protein
MPSEFSAAPAEPTTEAQPRHLDVVVGARTVGENLQRAVARGYVVQREDGRYSLRRPQIDADEVRRKGGFIGKRGTLDRPCEFLNHFLFTYVYAEAALPYSCRDCYKIRVAVRSLRALMAVKALAEATKFSTKSGPEVDNPYNRNIYSTCIYFESLEDAHDTHAALRQQIDAHPDLGPDVDMIIKRGCSNYERAMGPSDQYRVDPELAPVEAWLAERYVNDRPPNKMSKQTINALRMLDLIAIAFRIGDETYKDFTDGQPIYPSAVNYAVPPPEPAAAVTPPG